MNRTRTLIILCLWTCNALSQTIDSISWRGVFTDQHLVNLIEIALEQNADLRTANLNIEQAEATLRMTRLSILPSLTIGAEGSFSKAKGIATTKTYNLPLTMQWEVDLSGRLRGEKQTAQFNYWNTAETEQAVKLQVITAVASHYYSLMMLEEQLKVTRQSIINARQTMEVMETMKEVGLQNEAAVSQARAAWFNIAASEKSLLQHINTTENALRVLVGESLKEIECSSFEKMDVSINDSMPYKIQNLSIRPDVKAAEYALKAEIAQVNVARASFYPHLSVSASAGWTNIIGEAVNPGKMLLSTIGSLVQPLFDKGKNRANLRVAKARQEQALVAFNQSLLVAGTELNDALITCELSHERLKLRENEVIAAERAYEVSQELMRNSSTTYLEVLIAQSALLQSHIAIISDRLDYIQGKINLFKALGGNTEQ